MASEAGHEKNRAYFDQSGNIHLNGASLFDSGETDQKNVLAGTAAGKKYVAGVLTTATAADTVVTGLTTVIACGATLADDPGDDPELVSATIGDQAGSPAAGSIIVKTWKNTGGTDPTPVAASTFSKKVNWWAYGT